MSSNLELGECVRPREISLDNHRVTLIEESEPRSEPCRAVDPGVPPAAPLPSERSELARRGENI